MISFPLAGVTRPNFLILTPICILLGATGAMLSGANVAWSSLAVVLVGGLMAHISVNSLNEYTDYQTGLDFKTDRTPFSGGSGTLVMHPRLVSQALGLGIVSLVISIGCGIYLIKQAGWGLLPIGLIGVFIILFYTEWINRHRLLVLIAPGLSFGPLMVIGTHYALTGSYGLHSLLLSLIPFFLVNNLLFLNQIPDVEADFSSGRDNFAIAWGARERARLYFTFGLMVHSTIVLGVATGLLPTGMLIGLLTLWPIYHIYRGVEGYQGDVATLVPVLGKNVAVTLGTPLLVTLGGLPELVW